MYYQHQEQSQNRRLSGLNKILGAGPGAEEDQSIGSALGEGALGYLTSDTFGSDIGNIIEAFSRKKSPNTRDIEEPLSRGYVQ